MVIKVNDPRIGAFTWELPPDLASKWALRSVEMPEGTEEKLVKFIEENITNLLMVTCDALEFTPATPPLLEALFNNINQLIDEASDIVLIVENMDDILRLIKDKEEDPDGDDSPDDGQSGDSDTEEIDEYMKEDKEGVDGDSKDDSPPKGDDPV